MGFHDDSRFVALRRRAWHGESVPRGRCFSWQPARSGLDRLRWKTVSLRVSVVDIEVRHPGRYALHARSSHLWSDLVACVVRYARRHVWGFLHQRGRSFCNRFDAVANRRAHFEATILAGVAL